MHFAAVAYVGESTLEPLRYLSVNYLSLSYPQSTFLPAHGTETLLTGTIITSLQTL